MSTQEHDFIDRRFAGRTGRFLEIGANDGRWDSLTIGLVRDGWSGVMVEPDPVAFARLLQNHGANERLRLVHAAVTPRTGLCEFWSEIEGGQVSTTDTGHRDAFIAGRGAQYTPSYFVGCISPNDLLNAFGGPNAWQLVVVDVEGINPQVLESLPLRRMVDTEVLIVEFQGDPQEIIDRMAPMYEPAVVCEINVIGVRVK